MRLPEKSKLPVLLLVIVISFSIALNFGCMSMVEQAAEDIPPPPPPPDDEELTGSADIELTISKYLFKNEHEETDFGLYSYFLLSRKPSTIKDTNRYILMHKAFKTLITYAEYKAEAGIDTLSHENINVSYWPINNENDSSKEAGKIGHALKPDSFYVNNYNFACARMILMKMPDLVGPGPYIVSYGAPLRNMDSIDTTRQILIIDMSRIEDSLLVEVVDYFQRKVADDPDTWKDDFDWEMIKLNFYSALKIHGRPVIYAATWVKDFFGLKNIFGSG